MPSRRKQGRTAASRLGAGANSGPQDRDFRRNLRKFRSSDHPRPRLPLERRKDAE